MIDWSRTTRDDHIAINAIAEMVAMLDPTRDVLTTQMDLEACHTHGCPLDLETLRKAKKSDLMHDVAGIHSHIDHDTGELRDCFVPRCANPDHIA